MSSLRSFLGNKRSSTSFILAGFTIVELIVVISVIGILATIGFLSYNNWQASIITSTIKSDLSGAAAAMEDYRNFNNGYPSSLPSTFKSSPDVALTTIGGGTTFCISATSIKSPSVGYYYVNQNSGSQGAKVGSCTYILTTTAGNGGTVNPTGVNSYAINSAISVTANPNPYYAFNNWSGDCGSESTASITVTIDADKTCTASFSAITAPGSPVLSVSLIGPNVQAEITPLTCAIGVAQYKIRNRINDGAWLPYSDWSNGLIASQLANDGTKYGYQAQARCLVDGGTFSSSTVGTEKTYVDPISVTPPAPTVSNSTVSNITTYSWNASTCPVGTTASYQYNYTIDYSGGYTSSSYTTSNTSITYDTSSEGYNYTVNVKAKCSNSYVSGGYGLAGSSSYIRPVSYPGAIAYSIARDSRYQLSFSAASSCGSGAYLYSRLDLWMTSSYGSQTFWWSGTTYQTAGWYSSANSGVWNINTAAYYGSTVTQSVILNGGTGSYYYPPGMSWQMAVEMYCKNMTTGRTSSSTGRQTSNYLYAPSY